MIFFSKVMSSFYKTSDIYSLCHQIPFLFFNQSFSFTYPILIGRLHHIMVIRWSAISSSSWTVSVWFSFRRVALARGSFSAGTRRLSRTGGGCCRDRSGCCRSSEPTTSLRHRRARHSCQNVIGHCLGRWYWMERCCGEWEHRLKRKISSHFVIENYWGLW